MKRIRVFPRKTNATPEDAGVRFAAPSLFDEADEVRVSVSFTWDIPKAEILAEAWRTVTSNVSVGGPAYDDPGGDFTPGLYLKPGYVITSRGCPNHCWFCVASKREGTLRELPVVDGWNVQDNNLLACSDAHILEVFGMLQRQGRRPRFTGGLEAKRLQAWHVDYLYKLKTDTLWLAYDTPDDWEVFRISAINLLTLGGIKKSDHCICCYVLVGWAKDTLTSAETRLEQVLKLGIMPMAMLYNHGENRRKDRDLWVKFTRNWANPWVVGAKMKGVL